MALGICEGCRRFARGETCPFCGAGIGAPLPGLKKRSTRAGRVLGAAAVAVSVGCSTSAVYGGPPIDGSPGDDSAADAASSDGAKDAGPDTIMGAYGGPPIDAGDGG